VNKIARRERIHKHLLIIRSRVGGVYPIGTIEDYSFRIGIPAGENGVGGGRLGVDGLKARKNDEKSGYKLVDAHGGR
jgi:hypothetical protein